MQKQRHYQFYMNFMVWVLEIAEHFPMQLCFVTAKVNNPEVVIQKQSLQKHYPAFYQ